MSKELTKSGSNVERAIKGLKVRDASFQEVKDLLAKITLMYGIKMPDTEVERDLLLEHLQKYCSGLTIEELKLAFELDMTGELGESSKPFGVLSVSFIAEVVAKYREKRAKAVQRIKKELPEPKEVSDERCYEILLELMDKLGDPPFIYAWDKVYRHLEITGSLVLSVEDKKRIAEGVKSAFRKEGRFWDSDSLSTECRKVAVLNHIKNSQISNEVSINNELKT